MLLYSASYCFTVFDYKRYSDDRFSSGLFPWQVSVKIPVILNMSIKFVHLAQPEHEFLCFIDKTKKDTYDIRKSHSIDIKWKTCGKNLCRSLFWIKLRATDTVFFCEFTKFLKRAIHYQINQIRFIWLIFCIRFIWCGTSLSNKSDKESIPILNQTKKK